MRKRVEICALRYFYFFPELHSLHVDVSSFTRLRIRPSVRLCVRACMLACLRALRGYTCTQPNSGILRLVLLVMRCDVTCRDITECDTT